MSSIIDAPTADDCVAIGSKRIGPGQSVFIVAEAGVNHDGHVETALRMVDVAAEAGVDAVKFQMFSAASLVSGSAAAATYQRDRCATASQRELLAGLELCFDDFMTIAGHCRHRDVMFLATPFGVPEVRRLTEMGVSAIKIASTDLTHAPLLSAAAATTLPIILSTGASTESEIAVAVTALRQSSAGDRLVLLHCVSAYPTPMGRINLRAIRSLQRSFAIPCGLSDHTTSTQMGAWAVAAGACVLEKHFTLDPSAKGPDHAMSLDPERLAAYVAAVRDVEQAMGDGSLGLVDCEQEVRQVASRSVVAASDIAAGTRLTPAMLTLKRPGTGIGPARLRELLDRRTVTDIPSDTLLSWDMME